MPGSIVSKTMKKTFNYVEQFELNPGLGGTTASHFFSANSLFDPNVTGVGHQPMGFDQYVGTFYDHYTVIAAKLTLTAMARSTSSPASNLIVCLALRDGNTPTTNITKAIEQGRTVFGFIGATEGGASTVSLQNQMNVGRYLGNPNPLTEQDLRGESGASPAEQAYFEITAAAMDGSTDASPIDILVAIEYVAVLTEPKPLGQS